MKKIFIILILLLYINSAFSQNNVGIGTITPDSSAILELYSTDKGILIPRMSSTERTNMSPSLGLNQEGLLVYDNDSTKFFYWNAYSWQTIGSGTIGPQGAQGIANIQTYGVYGTNTVAVTSYSFVAVPGLSLSINLVDTATLNIFTYGGLDAYLHGSATGRIQLFMNGNPVAQAMQTQSMVGGHIPSVDRENWNISTFLYLLPGSYTFDIKAKIEWGDDYIAGSFSDSKSALMIQVFY
jgi:hypothetical protein